MKIVLEKTIENVNQIKRIKSQLGNTIRIKNQDKTKEQCMLLLGMNLRTYSLDFEETDIEVYTNKNELIVPNEIFDKLYVPVQEVNISGIAKCNGEKVFEF